MKKPKFLRVVSRRINRIRYEKRSEKERKREEKFLQSDKGRIAELESTVASQNKTIQKNSEYIEVLKNEKRQQEMELYRQEKERTNPYKADKWKVVYDSKGRLSTVYLNGKQLYGAISFSVDLDADDQTPVFSYQGYGSIEIITESE